MNKMYERKNCKMYNTVGMQTIFVFLLLFAACTGFAQHTNFKSCGIDDIDQIRREVKTQPTTVNNAISRRAALYRWWRLLWHQGYDMDAFDEVAEMLLRFPDSTLKGQQSITVGFMKLEEMIRIGKRIPEIRGKNSTKSSTVTNWPLYHGTDASQSGFSPDEGPSLGNIVWRFPKSYGCEISPRIDSGRVYLPGIGDDVIAYCLDEITGDVIWKGRKYGAEFYSNTGVKNSAILIGNRMLVMTEAGLKIFEKTTGKLLSQGKLSSEISIQETIHPKIVKKGLNHFLCIMKLE